MVIYMPYLTFLYVCFFPLLSCDMSSKIKTRNVGPIYFMCVCCFTYQFVT
jgi:hypothetical protein